MSFGCVRMSTILAASFVEVGNALMRIRDGRLYRATHATFEAYCLQKWDFSKTHVNRLVAASEVVENVTPIGVKPANEAQACPLTRIEDPKERADEWMMAIRRPCRHRGICKRRTATCQPLRRCRPFSLVE